MKKRMVVGVIIATLFIVTITFTSAHNNILQHILGKPATKEFIKDTVHIHGKIQKIENNSIDYIEVTIINDHKTLVLLVNNETT
ncbi:hypothetical protein IMX26_10015 [Clostridium sp. 'deep sea']|uniref:hypothetical protein n=1 Tax=Clostridium sp. 'deep sea' TaxID=2779445 RepID=UPI00189686D0|nr:hypothetical protein [Clostridium sp. 'deep sea']QOR33837.1 hypothetical protein IMX26_10015 [Clostridium sp. 'deep sea']